MSRASSSSVTIGSPVSALASASRRRRGARLVGAAAEQARAARGDRARRGHDLIARLDRARAGDQAEVVAADLAPVDLDDRALVRAQLGGGELERLQDRDDLGDAVVALEAEAGDMLAVADGADHRHLLPARGMRSSAAGLDAGDDGLHLLVGGRRLHHDHHGTAVLLEKWDVGDCRWSGARPGGPSSGRRWLRRATPAERLAKSPDAIGERPERIRTPAGGNRGTAGVRGPDGHRAGLAHVVPAIAAVGHRRPG
jgi:hypothetical protein